MVLFWPLDGTGVLQHRSGQTFKEALGFGNNKRQEEESLGQGDEVQTRPDDPLLREDAGVATRAGTTDRYGSGNRGWTHRAVYRGYLLF